MKKVLSYGQLTNFEVEGDFMSLAYLTFLQGTSGWGYMKAKSEKMHKVTFCVDINTIVGVAYKMMVCYLIQA